MFQETCPFSHTSACSAHFGWASTTSSSETPMLFQNSFRYTHLAGLLQGGEQPLQVIMLVVFVIIFAIRVIAIDVDVRVCRPPVDFDDPIALHAYGNLPKTCGGQASFFFFQTQSRAKGMSPDGPSIRPQLTGQLFWRASASRFLPRTASCAISRAFVLEIPVRDTILSRSSLACLSRLFFSFILSPPIAGTRSDRRTTG